MEKACKDCDFVFLDVTQHECHRYPPPWTNKMVDADDWCGEFKRSVASDDRADKVIKKVADKVDDDRSKKISDSYNTALSMFNIHGDMFCSLSGLGNNHDKFRTGDIKFTYNDEFEDTLKYLDDLYLAAVMMSDAGIPLTVDRLSAPLPTGPSFFSDVRNGTQPCSAAEKVIATLKASPPTAARKLVAPSKKKAPAVAKGKYGKK